MARDIDPSTQPFMVFLMGFHSDFIGFNGDWMEIEYKVVPPFDS